MEVSPSTQCHPTLLRIGRRLQTSSFVDMERLVSFQPITVQAALWSLKQLWRDLPQSGEPPDPNIKLTY